MKKKKLTQQELELAHPEEEITKAYMIIDGNSIIKKIKESLNFLEKISIMEYIPQWLVMAKYASLLAPSTRGRNITWRRLYFEVGEQAKLEIFHKNLSEKFHKEFNSVLIYPSESISEETCLKTSEEKIRDLIKLIAGQNSHVVLVSDNKELLNDLWQLKKTPSRQGKIVFCGYLTGEKDMQNLEERFGIEGWDIVSRCRAAKALPIFRPIEISEFDPSNFL